MSDLIGLLPDSEWQSMLDTAGLPQDFAGLKTVPVENYARFYRAAVLRLGNDFLGLPAGGVAPPGAFRMLCLAMVHTPNAQRALKRGAEFLDVLRGVAIKPGYHADRDQVMIAPAPAREMRPEDFARLLSEQSPLNILRGLAAWHYLVCWMAAQRLAVLRVDVAAPSDPYLAYYKHIFQAPIHFDQPQFRVVFRRSALQARIRRSEEDLKSFIKSCPYALMHVAGNDERTSSQVAILLGRDFRSQTPSLDSIADQLNLSASTLHRQLKSEGTSFKEIKDRLRKNACTNYLLQPDLSLTEIGELMGFDDMSSFYRSFKRWFGETPTSYRARLGLSAA
ncbi:MAG: AraC family transcriptional regulator [Mangrovicoccus sp.]|nr:AraC family transcriptional regulator [Mangrovicoccus sp.]